MMCAERSHFLSDELMDDSGEVKDDETEADDGKEAVGNRAKQRNIRMCFKG
jgi:hypothetical protein